jgi:hypothetical protein
MGAEIASHEGGVTLGQDHDLLLDVFLKFHLFLVLLILFIQFLRFFLILK